MGWFKNQTIRSKYHKASEADREQMRRDYPEAIAPLLRLEAKVAKVDQARGDTKARKRERKNVRSGR